MHLFAKYIPIIIMTPALIINTIESGKDPDILSCFTLLVFDECHHTYKEHIFNKTMRQYHIAKEEKKNIPQVTRLISNECGFFGVFLTILFFKIELGL